MTTTDVSLDQLCINTVRLLSADAVQKANSGHPGMPMGAAPMAHVLWTEFMNHNPADFRWPNRDRFILSAGHGSMLLYSMLHLTGYDLTLDDLKQFRQLHSKTPGHPESHLTDGVEMTTGPLGQGFATGVGMAIAQKHLAAHYNKPGLELFDYRIFAICSDGDLMEGISSEAGSLAGHLQLGNMVYLYDDNHISIDGSTDLAFTEDRNARFAAFGWHVQTVHDGNDVAEIRQALANAVAETTRPSLISVRTTIGFGSPKKAGTSHAHGEPLGVDELRATKERLGWDPDKSFYVPDDAREFYHRAVETGKQKQADWEQLHQQYRQQYPDLAKEYDDAREHRRPHGWADQLPTFAPSDPAMATRNAVGLAINATAAALPLLMGGAGDLNPSTFTYIKSSGDFQPGSYEGRNIRFGVREHAMGAVANGLIATEGFIPFTATFLIFSEYMRPPIRLAAIAQKRPIFIFTHDSIGLGEDGTTHQPIEQLIALRTMPNLTVIRPADANETAQAWRVAVERTTGPVVLILSRQKLPNLDQAKLGSARQVERGAYVLSEAAGGAPELILIATGSEVDLALKTQAALATENIRARVVSMPSWELFEEQTPQYRAEVLPPTVRRRLSIEMGSTVGWLKYTTEDGSALGIDVFGESAPAEALFKVYGFTVENAVARAKALLK